MLTEVPAKALQAFMEKGGDTPATCRDPLGGRGCDMRGRRQDTPGSPACDAIFRVLPGARQCPSSPVRARCRTPRPQTAVHARLRFVRNSRALSRTLPVRPQSINSQLWMTVL